MDRNTPTILPEYIASTLRYPLHLGLDLKQIEHHAGVDLSKLDTRRQPFSLEDVIRLVQANTHLSGLPHYGLANGHFTSLSCHGMAGLSAMYQSTYADCLQTGSRLCNLLFPPLTMHYFETEDQVGVRLYECLSLAPCTPFFMEWIMTNFHNILQFLLGQEHQPDYIAFPYQAPEYQHTYHRYLKCPLYFDVEHAEFVVDKTLAQSPLPLADRKIADTVEQRFIETLPREEVFVDRQVRALLAQHMGELLTFEEVAARLQMGTRTLRRHLQKMDTSFVDIMNDLRRETAISQLLNSNRSITDIATSLSFSDSSAFSKAFKRWTGQSPREFRLSFG